jgi:formylglycine-generating enzyme required for sulfatase activity
VPEGGVAQSIEGVPPQGYISGEVAEAACEAAGKRLCSLDEWLLACEGEQGRTYPYGHHYDETACNDSYDGGHPLIDYFGTSEGIWDMDHMNDPGINQQPGTVALTGEYEGCVTPEGVYDLHGNLHEWVSDPNGTFKGGFYADASINGEGCSYTTTAHEFSYHDYSTGFRCCAGVR